MEKLLLPIGIILAAVVGWVVLAGIVWAWALGLVWWHGAVASVVLAPLAVICLVVSSRGGSEQVGLSRLSGLLAVFMLVGLLLVLPIVGAIVGIVRLVY